MKSACFRAVLVAGVALVLSGCSSEHRVTAPRPVPAPVANSPTNAIRVFEWGWNHRDIVTFENLLTDDFRFVFALGDSAGNVFRYDPFTRGVMLTCLRHLFVGGGSESPAKSIVLNLDPTLRVTADDRTGKNPTWHKQIITTVDLTIKTEDASEYRITGNARFYVVRGDSALMPQELGNAGVHPDSTRWFMDRWQDETLLGGGVPLRALPADPQAPLPARNTTWGQILAFYRPPPVVPRH